MKNGGRMVGWVVRHQKKKAGSSHILPAIGIRAEGIPPYPREKGKIRETSGGERVEGFEGGKNSVVRGISSG